MRNDLIAAGHWIEITNAVSRVLGWIRAARGEQVFLGVERGEDADKANGGAPE